MPNKNWYVIYTRSRYEKKVKSELDKIEIENFLPMWKQYSQWSDRKKLVEMPMFKGYVFVNINLQKDQIKIYEVDGVVKFVSFDGKIAKISDKDLNWIKLISESEVNQNNNFQKFIPGDKVRISSGSLSGIEGIIDSSTKKNIKIYLESIEQAIYINIEPENLIKI